MWPTLNHATALVCPIHAAVFSLHGWDTTNFEPRFPVHRVRVMPDSMPIRAYCLLASLWLLEYADRSRTAQFDIPVESFNLPSNFLTK